MERYRKNPNNTRKRTNMTLDPEVWEAAQAICYAEGISVSELVNRLLKAEVTKDQKKKKKEN